MRFLPIRRTVSLVFFLSSFRHIWECYLFRGGVFLRLGGRRRHPSSIPQHCTPGAAGIEEHLSKQEWEDEGIITAPRHDGDILAPFVSSPRCRTYKRPHQSHRLPSADRSPHSRQRRWLFRLLPFPRPSFPQRRPAGHILLQAAY